MVFDSISPNRDDVLLINPSANVFVVGDFDVLQKDKLTYFGRTDGPSELCDDLTQLVNYPSGISDCDCQNPVLLDLFLSSDASICSTKACPPLGNSGYVVVSVYIDFQSNSKGDTLSHCIAYDYSCADWDGLHNDLTDVPGEDILGLLLLILLVNSVSGFRLELIYITLILSMWSSLTHLCGFQLFVLLPWFIKITVLICTNRINILNLKEKLIQAINCCKRVLEAAKLTYAYKAKLSMT